MFAKQAPPRRRGSVCGALPVLGPQQSWKMRAGGGAQGVGGGRPAPKNTGPLCSGPGMPGAERGRANCPVFIFEKGYCTSRIIPSSLLRGHDFQRVPSPEQKSGPDYLAGRAAITPFNTDYLLPEFNDIERPGAGGGGPGPVVCITGRRQ